MKVKLKNSIYLTNAGELLNELMNEDGYTPMSTYSLVKFAELFDKQALLVSKTFNIYNKTIKSISENKELSAEEKEKELEEKGKEIEEFMNKEEEFELLEKIILPKECKPKPAAIAKFSQIIDMDKFLGKKIEDEPVSIESKPEGIPEVAIQDNPEVQTEGN